MENRSWYLEGYKNYRIDRNVDAMAELSIMSHERLSGRTMSDSEIRGAKHLYKEGWAAALRNERHMAQKETD